MTSCSEAQDGVFAEDILERFLEMASERKRRSLRIVFDALITLRSQGATHYSVASVGKLSAKLGGPKEQSIRNTSGATFRELIGHFADAAGARQKAERLPNESQLEAAIRAIPDIGVRTLVNMKVQEGKRLKSENDRLRHAFHDLAVQSERKDIAEIGAGKLGERNASIPGYAVEAVRIFLSEQWLVERGLQVGPNGSIVDNAAGSDLIAPPGFVDALKALLDSRG